MSQSTPPREIMMKPPFRMMFLARSQSGKTTLLVKLLLYYWINMFDHIYVFCPTYSQDNKWKPVDKFRNSKVTVYSIVTEKRIQNIWNQAIKDKEKNENNQICIIMDDCMGQKDFKTNSDQGIINKLVCKGNHANISTIWSIQKITLCSTLMRVNVEGIIIFYFPEKELKVIYSEFGCGKQKDFIKLVEECTKNNYHTFFINRQGPGRPDYYHNFRLIDIESKLKI